MPASLFWMNTAEVPVLNIATELQRMKNLFCHPQPVPEAAGEEAAGEEAAGEEAAAENISQTRLKLLASLLRAIEETNGGTLSHLEDPQEKDGSPQQPPSHSGETGNSHVRFQIVFTQFPFNFRMLDTFITFVYL